MSCFDKVTEGNSFAKQIPNLTNCHGRFVETLCTIPIEFTYFLTEEAELLKSMLPLCPYDKLDETYQFVLHHQQIIHKSQSNYD